MASLCTDVTTPVLVSDRPSSIGVGGSDHYSTDPDQPNPAFAVFDLAARVSRVRARGLCCIYKPTS